MDKAVLQSEWGISDDEDDYDSGDESHDADVQKDANDGGEAEQKQKLNRPDKIDF